MTKKLPMPTASRMTRVWLPGRARLRTACRSGNQRDRATGRTSADDAGRGEVEHQRDAGEPGAHDQPDAQRRRLPAGDRDQGRADEDGGAGLHPVALGEPRANPRQVHHPGYPAGPVSPGSMPPRSSSSGLTRRTSSSGTSENSSDTSSPTLTPCQTADAVSA